MDEDKIWSHTNGYAIIVGKQVRKWEKILEEQIIPEFQNEDIIL